MAEVSKPRQKNPGKIKVTEEKSAGKASGLFPVVGIGASAGGLEAFEQFLANVPVNSGMAYVIIQHLDPTQKGMLPELLQRITKLQVFQAKDRMPVKPNCVYVIPPNKNMSISNRSLYLFAPQETRGLRLPIDFFFRSLAEDLKELSVGIILSGMGSDGRVGLSAIKESNGIAMAQDPVTAKFDSMPRQAIDFVNVDIVAPAEELPAKLTTFLHCIPLIQADLDLDIKDKSSLEKIVILLRNHTGHDFSLYKKSTLYRRIERRIGIHKIDKIASYVRFLQENPKELDILFKELLIGVTRFFRDEMVWEKMANTIIPAAIADAPEGSVLRAWVAGCSSGEEAYSLAIIFKEALLKSNPFKSVYLQIFASDLDNDSIEIARKGKYPENIVADVSPELINRYFVKTEEGYCVTGEIREMVVFAQHNLIMQPPFINIDIISCRNLLIYLEAELQKKVLGLFFYSLTSDGILLLGNSETIGTISNFFKPIDSKLKIYKRSNEGKPDMFNIPSAFSRIKPAATEKTTTSIPARNIQTLADQLLLMHFAPSGVLVNDDGDILYISGKTGKYLEPASGKANLNIFTMLREGLRQEFPVAFMQTVRKKEATVIYNVKVRSNGFTQITDIHIHYIDKPESLRGLLMVIFSDVREIPVVAPQETTGEGVINSGREVQLEKELMHTREEMQSTMEEMQTTQEELKSTNEELQSANEELQSTNEELTSSKEEMQSLNEELQTLNAELQTKIDEYTRVDNDMKNLLNSTDIATLFLDKELNIRRYTNQATKIFKFIKTDIGRPFTDQVSDLLYPEMAEDANEVLRTLAFIQKQIPGKDGRWFSVRIMPYRTFDDRIEGLVITFINITELKNAEEKLKQMRHE